MIKQDFLIFHDYIPKVGGIESAVYNLAKALDREGYNVRVAYNSAETWESVIKYAQVADVVKLLPDTLIKTDVCLIASNHEIPKQIEAKRFLQWIHSDYDKYVLKLKNIGEVEYIAVSKHCADVIKKREGVEARVIYNLVDRDFGKGKGRLLRLVTNSRVSPEKGFDRMLQLAEKLKENKVRFVWTVYGDNSHFPKEYQDWIDRFKHIEEVHWVGYKKDVSVGLEQADYLVQLSNFEGCPLAVLEALYMKVPVIVSSWLGVDELVKEGENGYILPMDMKDIDIDKIVNKIPVVKEYNLSSIKEWEEVINDEKTGYI